MCSTIGYCSYEKTQQLIASSGIFPALLEHTVFTDMGNGIQCTLCFLITKAAEGALSIAKEAGLVVLPEACSAKVYFLLIPAITS